MQPSSVLASKEAMVLTLLRHNSRVLATLGWNSNLSQLFLLRLVCHGHRYNLITYPFQHHRSTSSVSTLVNGIPKPGFTPQLLGSITGQRRDYTLPTKATISSQQKCLIAAIPSSCSKGPPAEPGVDESASLSSPSDTSSLVQKPS